MKAVWFWFPLLAVAAGCALLVVSLARWLVTVA